MRRKASISHHEALIRQLRDNPDLAVQYFKAALEEDSEPRVLLIACAGLCRLGESPKPRASSARAFTGHCLRAEIPVSTLAAVTKAIELRLRVEAGR
jgi:hypothetical protein